MPKFRFLLKRPPSDLSPGLTISVVGTAIALLKLLLSGIIIKGFTFETFTGSEFAIVVAALEGLRQVGKTVDSKIKMKEEMKEENV